MGYPEWPTPQRLRASGGDEIGYRKSSRKPELLSENSVRRGLEPHGSVYLSHKPLRAIRPKRKFCCCLDVLDSIAGFSRVVKQKLSRAGLARGGQNLLSKYSDIFL